MSVAHGLVIIVMEDFGIIPVRTNALKIETL